MVPSATLDEVHERHTRVDSDQKTLFLRIARISRVPIARNVGNACGEVAGVAFVGDQALMRVLDTAFPIMRPGLSVEQLSG
jgi:hypothetical protein